MTFEEPVGVFVPDEVVKKVASFGEAVILDKFLDFFVSLIDLVANPVFAVVLKLEGLLFGGIFGVIVDHLLDEAGDVPEFVAEVARGDDFADTKGLVDASATGGDETKAERIGAIFGNDSHRINDIALGFGHLLSFFV